MIVKLIIFNYLWQTKYTRNSVNISIRGLEYLGQTFLILGEGKEEGSQREQGERIQDVQKCVGHTTTTLNDHSLPTMRTKADYWNK